ncbi:MAG: methionine--tRNA ligase [Candidatus Margulisbacteria bacterium]|nr:methionine--tRNA ligase [Candidatus Margulisiibacteriota bacterium]
MKRRKILITSALPYANGDIHLGHLVEYLQTDFWVRFQKMRGHEAIYVCADDTHGTPIMISAREQGITPEKLIAMYHEKHLKDFEDFEISFDNYYSTHSQENKEFAEEFYSYMKEGKHLDIKKIKQLYCEKDKMFLPDRFVKGTCPKCGAKDQYGDSCDVCSATYTTSELKEANCIICKSKPVEKESEHVFFRLNDYKAFLQDWIKDHTQPEVRNKLEEWLKEDLKDWNISRDEPYFGFTIPGMPYKYFYVWLDAPIGYISSTKNWCSRNGRDYKEFWKDEGTELYHFIGKDIVYFHTLFWPAMLKTVGYKTPDQIFVHGFLTINGEKMSKSKGTFIKARNYLDLLNPLYLRYYYAGKMTSSIDDIDLSLEDFFSKVNAELIGKITNLASRSIQMLNKAGANLAEPDSEGMEMIREAQSKGEIVAEYYEQREFAKVIMEIRGIAEKANKYFDTKQPWQLIKSDQVAAIKVLSSVINIFRIIAIFLKPVLPSYVQKVETLFNENSYAWSDYNKVLADQKINNYEHLLNRIEKDAIDKLIQKTCSK